jgi:hypothetical protein
MRARFTTYPKDVSLIVIAAVQIHTIFPVSLTIGCVGEDIWGYSHMNGIKRLSVKKYKSCAYCGVPFYSMDARQKYCCDRCKSFMCLYRKSPHGMQEHRALWVANTEGIDPHRRP